MLIWQFIWPVFDNWNDRTVLHRISKMSSVPKQIYSSHAQVYMSAHPTTWCMNLSADWRIAATCDKVLLRYQSHWRSCGDHDTAKESKRSFPANVTLTQCSYLYLGNQQRVGSSCSEFRLKRLGEALQLAVQLAATHHRSATEQVKLQFLCQHSYSCYGRTHERSLQRVYVITVMCNSSVCSQRC